MRDATSDYAPDSGGANRDRPNRLSVILAIIPRDRLDLVASGMPKRSLTRAGAGPRAR